MKNIFKQTLVSLWGNKLRTIIWWFLFTLIIVILMSLFFVNGLYNSMIDEVYQNDPIPIQVVTHTPKGLISSKFYDWEKYQKITDDEHNQIGNIETVSSLEKEMTSSIAFGDLKFKSDIGQVSCLSAIFSDNLETLTKREGYTFDVKASEFKDNSIILSEEMLEQNNLSVGDSVKIDLNGAYSEEVYPELKNIDFNIVGSFNFTPTQKMIDKHKQAAMLSSDQLEYDSTFEDKQLFIPQIVGEKIIEFETELGIEQVTVITDYLYYLNSVHDLPAFTSDAKQMIDFDIDVIIDTTKFPNKVDIINKLNRVLLLYNTYFTILSIVTITLILFLGFMYIHNRKNELAILLALGLYPKELFMQLILEQALPMVSSLILIYIVWSIIANHIVGVTNCGQSFMLKPFIYTSICMSGLIVLSCIFAINYLKQKQLITIL